MNKTLLLIGGLGLGAGLMYALDPERGQQRRAQARAHLQTYRHRTNDLLDEATHAIGRQTHGMQQAVHTIGHQARGLLARARPTLSSQRGVEEMRWPTMGQTGIERGLLILGCLGLGAGLMYLLDPNNGTRRRNSIRDKAQAYWKRQEDFLGKTVCDVGSRTRSLVAEARSHLSSTEVPDDASLVARVRAQIGHIASKATTIGVTARQGCVTLSGSVPAAEANKLLSAVEGVAGVKEVVNQLDIQAEREHSADVQGHNTAR